MADRFPLILNTSTNQIQEIPSGDNLDLTGVGINNVGVITSGNVTIGAATTDLLVNGDARVTGILTVGTGSLTLDGPNNLVNVGTALTLGHTQGLQFHTQNLHSAGFEVNQINVSGASTMGDDVTFNGASSKNMVWDSSDGDLEFADNARLKFGNDDDFFLYHNGSHSYIKNSTNYLYYLATQHHFKNAANNELQAKFQENGPVELYHDNTKRFETTTSGVTITGDGTFTGNVSVGGTLTYEDVTNIDSVGVITARSGINLTGGNITLGDTSDGSSDDLLIFGAGSDLKIYHDSNHSYIQNATGDLFIKSNADDLVLQAADDVLIRPQNGEDGIKVIGDGAVELYHDNSKKFFTISNGVQATNRIIVGEGNAERGILSGDANSVSVGSISDIPLNFNRNSQIKARIDGNDFQIPNDNGKIELGASQDLSIYHNGVSNILATSNGNIELVAGSEYMAKFIPNAAVELYHNNVLSLTTTTEGIEIKKTASGATARLQIEATNGGQAGIELRTSLSGTNRAARIDMYNQNTLQWSIFNDYQQNGTNDFSIRHGAEAAIRALPDGAVQLSHDNSVRIETLAEGAKVKRHSGGSTTLYVEGAEGGSAIIDMFADDGDDNADKYRLSSNSGGTFLVQNYSQGGWQNNIAINSNLGVDLYYTNSKRFETYDSGVKVTGDLALNHSSSSTNTTGYAVQRIWAPTIAAGNVYKCGQWYEGEGAIQLYISVRSVQGGHSGSATYLFQGGYASISGQGTKRLLPLASGRGHGDSADTGMNSNAWEVLIDNINNYTYAVYIHVPSGRSQKIMQVAVTEMNRGNTFTDISSSVAYSSISSSVTSGDLTSLQTSHAEVVRQHSLPSFRVGRNTDQNVNSGDAIKFNVTSGASQYFNQGGHYNPSTGYFTAPYSGVYHFYGLIIFEGIPDNTDMTDSWDFYLNNSQLAYTARRAKYRADYTGTTGYYTDPATVTIFMNTGDYVWCRNKKNGKTIHDNPTYSYFCGHFCG